MFGEQKKIYHRNLIYVYFIDLPVGVDNIVKIEIMVPKISHLFFKSVNIELEAFERFY